MKQRSHRNRFVSFVRGYRAGQTISGVLAADLSYTGIVSGAESISGNNIEGYQPAPAETVRLQENSVGPGYFAATGMTLREGRLLTERDTDGSTRVVVVNEATVRRYFGGQSPIGKRLGYGTLDTQIVGVVADARLNGLRREPVPMAFYPLDQRPRFPRYLDARAIGDPAAVGGSVSRLLADLDPRVRVDSVRSISDALNRGIRRDRALAYVASAFGSWRCCWPASGSTACCRMRWRGARAKWVCKLPWVPKPPTCDVWS